MPRCRSRRHRARGAGGRGTVTVPFGRPFPVLEAEI